MLRTAERETRSWLVHNLQTLYADIRALFPDIAGLFPDIRGLFPDIRGLFTCVSMIPDPWWPDTGAWFLTFAASSKSDKEYLLRGPMQINDGT